MDLKTRYNRALKLSQKGAYIKAIEEFDKILSFNPGHADSLSDRGVAKYHINDYKGALEDMDKALNLEPENPYRYASRAFIKDRAGDTQGAIKDYQKALELEPDNAVSQNNLGLLEEKLGYMQRAQKRYKIADKLSEDIEPNSISFAERDQMVNDLLQELNIEVKKEEKAKKSLITQMFSVLTSSQERRDFFLFLKKLLKIS